jgi:hypothetical protein
MNQFDLTDEQRQIQEMAQQFTADALTPHAAEWDEKHIFPRETIKAAPSSASAPSMCRRRAAGSGSGGSRRR